MNLCRIVGKHDSNLVSHRKSLTHFAFCFMKPQLPMVTYVLLELILFFKKSKFWNKGQNFHINIYVYFVFAFYSSTTV